MFKVISAEIKKILSKPGIYVLAVVLAAILVLGAFIYKPTAAKNVTFTLVGTTYTEKYSDFKNPDGGIKKILDEKISDSIISIENYTETVSGTKITKAEHINSLFTKVENTFDSYRDCASYDNNAWIITQRSNLVSSLKTLDSQVVTSVADAANGSYAMLTTNKNFEEYKAVIKESITWAEVSVEKEKILTHCKEFESNIKPKLSKCLNSFIYPTLSEDLVTSYTTNSDTSQLGVLYARLNVINCAIEENYQIAVAGGVETNTKTASKMDELANLYANTANTYLNLVKYELLVNAFNKTTAAEQMDLMYLKDYSEYNNNSLLIKFRYLFNNNETAENFANPLTIGTTSNKQVNAYDYAYFVLKLFSFVIIAYSVMLACHSIAGEVKDGSMRYFAIRPVSRAGIFFGKLLAILILSSILVIFSGIIALCVGGAVYSFNTLNILTIFNGSNAIVIHPLAMIGIFLGSLIIEIMVYTSIALFISTLIKSDLFAVTIVLLLYLVNTLLPMFVQGSNTWLSFYPFSHISLYSLLGSAVYANNNFFNLLLGAKVYATTGIGLTICVVVLLITLINFFSVMLFKRKEL